MATGQSGLHCLSVPSCQSSLESIEKKLLEKYTFLLQKRPFDYVNRGTSKKILLTSEGGGDGHICIEACWWVPENVKSFKKMVPGNVKSFKKWVYLEMSRDQIFFLILSTVDDEFFSFC